MSIRLRGKYSPFYCGYPSAAPSYYELRWDVVGCLLRCEFCWSPASRPENMKESIVEYDSTRIYRETTKSVSRPEKTFIRFTGGEPTLYWDNLVDVLAMLANDENVKDCPILIQTNGVLIGKGEIDLDLLGLEPTKRLRLLFELSLKGTNSDEFEILTTKDRSLYYHQLDAYDKFKQAAENNPNLSFVTVLGIYHSSINSHLAFLDDPMIEPNRLCIAEMSGPPFITLDITLVPFTDETFGISGVVPEGWSEVSPGIYERSALGLVIILQQAAPGMGADALLQLLATQLGLSEVPESVGSRKANEFNWSLYEVEVQGVALDLAIAESDETSYLILLQTTAGERDFYYREVYLPAIDALTPMQR